MALCENIKWAHLPVAGGLYDQHPSFIDGALIFFSMKAEHEANEEKKRQRENELQQRQAASRSRSRASRSR